MKPKAFLQELREAEIVVAIQQAERKTSGEIRVFVSHKNVPAAVEAARAAFVRLRLTRTRERNAVLIFVAPHARQFAVIGDEGVHQRCGEAFWRQMAEEMSGHFKAARFTEGIVHAVRTAGDLLAEHFPHRRDDQNELPDRVAHD